MDKLGIFHVNQTSICLDPHQKQWCGRHCQTCLSPPVKTFFTDRSKAVLLLWILSVMCVSCTRSDP